ncbi:MAG TPA: translocation/assembly module TamB domain-containing protein [bacterium]|nr:translocation/assembly module TamB domain-containing protein [bacterium]
MLDNLSKKPDSVSQPSPQDTNSESKGYRIRLADFQIKDGKINLKEFSSEIPDNINQINLQASARTDRERLILGLNRLSLKTSQPQYVLQQMSFQIEKIKDRFYLHNFQLTTAQNRLLAQGFYNSQQEQASFDLNTDPINFSEFQNLFSNGIPKVSPSLNLNAEYEQDSIQANFIARQDSQRIGIKLNATDVQHLNKKEKKVIKYKLENDFHNLNIAEWSGDSSLKASLNGRLQIQGQGLNPDQISGQYHAELGNCQIFNHNLTSLNAKGTYSRNEITGGLTMLSDFGHTELDGIISNIQNNPKYELDLAISDLNLQKITADSAHYSNMNFQATLQGQGSDLAQATGEASVKISKSHFANFQIDTAFSSFSYQRQKYNIDTLHMRTNFAKLGLSGILAKPGSSNLRAFIQWQNMSPLEQYIPIKSIQSQGQIRANLQGEFDSLSVGADLNIDNLTYQNNTIKSISGRVSFLFDNQIQKAASQITMTDLSRDNLTLDSVEVSSDFADNAADYSIDIVSKENRAFLKGKAQFDSLPEIVISELAIDWQEQKWSKSDQDIRFILDNGNYYIQNFDLTEIDAENPASIAIQGLLSNSGQEDLRVELENFAIEEYSKYFTVPTSLTGNFGLDLLVQGNADHPLINGTLSLSQGSINQYNYKKIVGKFGYQDQTLNWNFLLNSGQADSILIKGNTYANLSLPNKIEIPSPAKPWQLQIKTDNFPLSMIKAGNLPIKSFQGTAQCNLNFQGTLQEPHLDGHFTIKDANLYSPDYGINYKNINMMLSLQESRIALEQLNLKSSKGRLQMQGGLELSNISTGEIGKYNFGFNAKKFYMSKHPDHQIQISGKGNIQGDGDQPQFSGKLTVLRSSLNLAALTGGESAPVQTKEPLLAQAQEDITMTGKEEILVQPQQKEKQTGSSKIWNNLKGEYRIIIPRNTWIRNNNMRAELSGKIDLVKTDPELNIFGEINLLRGYYDFVGRRFKIQDGSIVFQGIAEINPRITLRAEYTFRNQAGEKKTLVLHISGQAREPVIEFKIDDKKINEGDALAYIMFGKSLAQLSTGQQEDLSESVDQESKGSLARQMAANFLSSELSKILSKQLNLDYIEIKTEDSWQSASFVVGKYITNDLFVSYQKGLGTTQEDYTMSETVKLEYQLTKIIFLQLTGHEKYSGADVIFQIRRE